MASSVAAGCRPAGARAGPSVAAPAKSVRSATRALSVATTASNRCARIGGERHRQAATAAGAQAQRGAGRPVRSCWPGPASAAWRIVIVSAASRAAKSEGGEPCDELSSEAQRAEVARSPPTGHRPAGRLTARPTGGRSSRLDARVVLPELQRLRQVADRDRMLMRQIPIKVVDKFVDGRITRALAA